MASLTLSIRWIPLYHPVNLVMVNPRQATTMAAGFTRLSSWRTQSSDFDIQSGLLTHESGAIADLGITWHWTSLVTAMQIVWEHGDRKSNPPKDILTHQFCHLRMRNSETVRSQTSIVFVSFSEGFLTLMSKHIDFGRWRMSSRKLSTGIVIEKFRGIAGIPTRFVLISL